MPNPDDGQRLGAAISSFAQDGAALLGAGLITYGAELVYRPAGFVVGGLFLLTGAWLAARKAD